MIRTGKAIMIFIEYWRKENRYPTKKEFNEMWCGDKDYYYKVKKQFEKNFDQLVMEGTN